MAQCLTRQLSDRPRTLRTVTNVLNLVADRVDAQPVCRWGHTSIDEFEKSIGNVLSKDPKHTTQASEANAGINQHVQKEANQVHVGNTLRQTHSAQQELKPVEWGQVVKPPKNEGTTQPHQSGNNNSYNGLYKPHTSSGWESAPTRTLDPLSSERKVPSTQIGRIMGFAGMGASLALGLVQDSVSNVLGRRQPERVQQNTQLLGGFLSERNAEVLAAGLCRMRGAALKLGQMLSLQDESVLPPNLQRALERVRAGADYMPRSQLEGVLKKDLGAGWQRLLAEFDFTPMAAASIGQVHRGILHDGRQVAMKVQYPGVAQSISSDLKNLMQLLKVADVLPAGMYLDNAAQVMERELALECDYIYEMKSQARFKELIEGDEACHQHFRVPAVVPELSSPRVLTSEWVPGVAIDKVREMPSDVRNRVGTRLLHITLKELFTWRFMQTDPNWGNFLYDIGTDKLSLIDFGAAREYPKTFVDKYLHMVQACAMRDREKAILMSQKLGFLTGDESRVMVDDHCEAAFIVGLPFGTDGDYDFASHSQLTPRVAELGNRMLKHRLCPPPDEAYSLHRKLSGAFLCCIKLGARIPSRDLFVEVYNRHTFD